MMQVMHNYKYVSELKPSAWNQLKNKTNYYMESVRKVPARDIFTRQIFLVKKWFADPNLSTADWALPT